MVASDLNVKILLVRMPMPLNKETPDLGGALKIVPPRMIYAVQNFSDRIGRLGGKKPSFVIIGTGRCGTNFVSEYLTRAGCYCGHEEYFRPSGPRFFQGRLQVSPRGDSSWMAVPFLPDRDILAIHQTRAPLEVIKSFLKLGFFHERHYERHKRYVDFARMHFNFSDDPLTSAIRWWIEWNEKCMEITPMHFQIEKFQESTDRISEWLGLESGLPKVQVAKDTNSKKVIVSDFDFEVEVGIRASHDYGRLEHVAGKLGYKL